MSVREAALWHASEGRAVFPLAPRSKRPMTAHGFRDATTDEAAIRAWPADVNLGLPCDTFLVLDVDKKPDADGSASLASLLAEHGDLPTTWHATTPSGGEHFYFVPPPGAIVTRAIGVRLGIDVLGHGGYVVASPSVTDAGAYAFDDGGVPLAIAPPWVCSLAKPVEPTASPILFRGRWGSDLEERVARALAYVGKMDPAISGSRGHDALFRVAVATVRGFELPDAIAKEILRDYSQRCEPPWSDKEITHKIVAASRSTLPAGYLLTRVA